jgi:hypothetical protein
MRRYISLLLFIGLAWGQSDYDELVIKEEIERPGNQEIMV